ncbi:hypothetical protein N7478_005518 [Penicillium angulare]|uniref:uncharacterized protein n=1 Tax=Penicillium angulare TaxID=116970 RepID=UPI002540346B|nr:uncharacterized protein N7478_005518 [Penicillium angulare]KAJ5280146.1 hypothetical protein N7478_005518 [Penicillium angulare]
MSGGDNITLSSNVLGTIGTVLWCIQLIPQIWYNYRRKKTDGFPAAMMFLWASSTMLCLGTSALFGGLEALLILTLRIPYNKGVTWPDIVVGVIAAVLLSAGLLPPYFELWKRDGRVIGFTAQGSFDILGGIMYILVVVLEAGIYLSHIIWRIRYRKLRKEAKSSGISIDDLLALNRNDTEETRDTRISTLGSVDIEKQAAASGQSPPPRLNEQPLDVGEKC